ncbi:MAG: GTPase HflX [Bacilli bacterium]|nr:GTPase HflX [Bacilli bacterium]
MDEGFSKAIVISVGKNNSIELNHAQNEFALLLKEINFQVVEFFSQNIDSVENSTYVGAGKLAEVAAFYHRYNEENPDSPIELVACNFELTGLQKKTISQHVGAEIIDRTFVILDIFEKNAKTREAKLQVSIARLQYLKSHLVDEKASYSQVTSGSGHNKGKGEKQIELSRRQINKAVAQKKKELEEIKLSRRNMRVSRLNNPIPKVCIVGYTNAGKSTLLNRLVSMGKENKTVLEKNALFATLETATRGISIYGYPSFFLTDTVGFISNLPIYLVDAFRSTLEEIKEADLLVQVVDISDPFKEEEIATTKQIIKDLEADQIPMINIYNKYDLLGGSANFLPKEDEMFVSLLEKEDVEEALKFIVSNVTKNWERHQIELPYSIDFVSFSKENYVVSKKEKEDGYLCDVFLNPAFKYKYLTYLK